MSEDIVVVHSNFYSKMKETLKKYPYVPKIHDYQFYTNFMKKIASDGFSEAVKEFGKVGAGDCIIYSLFLYEIIGDSGLNFAIGKYMDLDSTNKPEIHALIFYTHNYSIIFTFNN
jgi:hypothetical protein